MRLVRPRSSSQTYLAIQARWVAAQAIPAQAIPFHLVWNLGTWFVASVSDGTEEPPHHCVADTVSDRTTAWLAPSSTFRALRGPTIRSLSASTIL